MNTNFAEVVEDVRQLSFDEKIELKDLLELYLIEERRQEILENGEQRSDAGSSRKALEFSSRFPLVHSGFSGSVVNL